jgi:TRAP-type transport system periplasmic protein
MIHKKLISASLAAAFLAGLAINTAGASELSLSYFMGPKHPMNRAVFTPFAKKLAEVSAGKMTVKQYPGGALNSAPPKQYSILLKGVADIAFALPGYTGKLFPVTNTVTIPGVCADALDCTKAMWRAMPEIEKEFKAKLLAVWANDIPVLLTKKKAVRSLADMKGMKVRVTSKQDVAFMEALGASAVAQSVTVINRNLANGTIDAIAIDPSAIRSFKLWEPAKYVTVGLPGAGSAFVLMMNQGVYNKMSKQEKAWVDQASGKWLSLQGGAMYKKAAIGGLGVAKKKGVEVIMLSDAERAKAKQAMVGAMTKFRATKLRGGKTGGQIIDMMKGK